MNLLRLWTLFILFGSLSAAHGALKPSCMQILKSLASAPKISLSLFAGVTDLKPTQFDYGLPRVKYLTEKFQEMEFNEVQEYLDQHPIPVVLGFNSDYYLVDRHNTLRALAQSQDSFSENFGSKANELELRLVIVDDKSSLSEEDFYNQMLEDSLLYPYRKGKSLSHAELPKQVLDLKKDYFRGIAWLLKKAEVIGANDIPFSDFMWANKMREITEIEGTIWSEDEVRKHLKSFISNHDEFSQLPGFQAQAPDLEKIMDKIRKYIP